MADSLVARGVCMHLHLCKIGPHQQNRPEKLTYGVEIAIVRRFREYPDRAVGKIQRAEGSRKALAIWPHRMPQGKKSLGCVTLDTRDSPQDIPGRGFMGSECRKSAAHRNRACDTLHLGWAMRAGTAKRSRLILCSKGKTLGHRRLLCLACCTALQTQQQGRSSSETLQRSQFFACTAKSEALALLRVSHRFGFKVLRAFTKEF
jgi:hypothetical protein